LQKLSPTRLEQTEIRYIKRSGNIIKKYEAQLNKNFSDNHESFLSWLVEETTGKSFSNLRQIKASLVFYAISINQEVLADKIATISSSHTAVKSPNNATSSQKKKSVTESEDNKITQYLRMKHGSSTDSGMNKPTLAFFKAGLNVGLRPCEWESAILIKHETSEAQLKPPILKVVNAKSTNGRSFGTYRYVGLSSLSSEQLLWINIALAYAKNPISADGKPSTFTQMYESMRKRMYKTTKTLFPNQTSRVTLYSCRHQLIANLKKNGCSLPEIAAIAGHGSDETASEHYGKKKKGINGKRLPLANPGDISKIRNVYTGRVHKVGIEKRNEHSE
jgi:hypothetical protein